MDENATKPRAKRLKKAAMRLWTISASLHDAEQRNAKRNYVVSVVARSLTEAIDMAMSSVGVGSDEALSLTVVSKGRVSSEKAYVAEMTDCNAFLERLVGKARTSGTLSWLEQTGLCEAWMVGCIQGWGEQK